MELSESARTLNLGVKTFSETQFLSSKSFLPEFGAKTPIYIVKV